MIDEGEDDIKCEGHGHDEQIERDFEQVIQLRNAQIVNCTTPAQYFHVLRRQVYFSSIFFFNIITSILFQVHREFRKPLIVVSPKNLLRHKEAVSTLEEMSLGQRFHRVIGDGRSEGEGVEKVVLCSGKVYYDLLDERTRLINEGSEIADKVALVRVEQVAPFPFDAVKREVSRYPTSAELVWVQEEPRNYGCWAFVEPRIRALERKEGTNREVTFVGRWASASPATGLGTRAHQAEFKEMMQELFN